MGISIKVKKGLGDKEDEPINDSFITTERMAVLRGKRHLDETYYLIKKRTLRVPHKNPNIKPGCWIKATESRLGLNKTPLKVVDFRISIQPNEVWATLETEQYVEP